MRPLRLVLCVAALATRPALAEDVVRLANLKFGHYGAVSYMKEIAPRFGVRIDEKFFAKGVDIIPAIVAGEIDLAASAIDGAVSGRASGAPLYIVGSFAEGGVRIVGRSDLAIRSIKELKGRKVGVTRGGIPELLLLAELAQAGLTSSDKGDKDVQLMYLAYADLVQALQQKSVDAISQAEPHASQAIGKGFGAEILKPYDTPLGRPGRALVMTEKLYKEKPDVALRTLKCFVAATRYFIEHPDFAEKYVLENMFKGGYSSRDYREGMSNANLATDITVEHVQTHIDLMMKYGVGRMAKPPVAKDFVKIDLLEKAKRELAVQ